MTNFLLTGARSGIGLECVRQLSRDPNNTIVACVKCLQGDLGDLKAVVSHEDNKSTIHIVELDLSCEDSIGSLVSRLPGGLMIDQVIQFAAILLDEDRKKTALTVTKSLMMETYNANVVGPVLFLQALEPRLAQSAHVLYITSGLASCTMLTNGSIKLGNPAYSISKTAFNMFTVHAAQILAEKRKAVLALADPGWVKTKMGGPGAMIEPRESAEGLLKLVRGLKAADAGVFFLYDGSRLPW